MLNDSFRPLGNPLTDTLLKSEMFGVKSSPACQVSQANQSLTANNALLCNQKKSGMTAPLISGGYFVVPTAIPSNSPARYQLNLKYVVAPGGTLQHCVLIFKFLPSSRSSADLAPPSAAF